jgi:molecular chaperone GrpE
LAKKKNQSAAEEPEIITEQEQGNPNEAFVEETEEETDPLQKLMQEIVVAKEEAGKNWDLYLRERADLENARKRHQRDREEAIRFANDRLLREMIPVLDNLERAVGHAEQGDTDNQGLLEGVNMTINQFRKVLEDFGVKPINALGEDFDPNLHQAMGQVETTDQLPNTVISEFQKGYLLNDRLLRPSLVMVARAPNGATEDQDAEATGE